MSLSLSIYIHKLLYIYIHAHPIIHKHICTDFSLWTCTQLSWNTTPPTDSQVVKAASCARHTCAARWGRCNFFLGNEHNPGCVMAWLAVQGDLKCVPRELKRNMELVSQIICPAETHPGRSLQSGHKQQQPGFDRLQGSPSRVAISDIHLEHIWEVRRPKKGGECLAVAKLLPHGHGSDAVAHSTWPVPHGIGTQWWCC